MWIVYPTILREIFEMLVLLAGTLFLEIFPK